MSETRYVRIHPYDKKRGHLCRRFNVGGQLFEAGRWYSLDRKVAETLGELEQSPGTAVFGVYTQEQYEKVARAELAAAYLRAGQGMPAFMQAEEAPPVSKAPKTGARKSKFAGLQATEVDASTAVPKPPVVDLDEPDEDEPADEPDTDDEGDDTDEAEVVDVDAIRTHAQADAIAARYDVDVSEAKTVADKRDLLAEALFGDDED